MDGLHFGSFRASRLLVSESDKFLRYLQYTVYGSLILYFGRDVLIPFAFAILISFLLYPSCAWLERKGVGRMWAVILNLSILVIIVVAIAALMVQQFLSFLTEWPALKDKLLIALADVGNALAHAFGVSAEQQEKLTVRLTEELTGGTFSLAREAISISAISAVMVILIPVYTVLILYYRHQWVKVLYRIFPAERNETTKEILTLTMKAYFNFIKGMGIVYLIVGSLNSVGLVILGVPHAVLFGFIASILTFVPYVGIMIGSLLPITMAWTTYDSAWYAFGVVIVFTVVQYLEANVIFPIAVSNRLKVNTLSVLFSIFAGGIIWGVSGMILFVPMVGIVKLIADHNYRFKTLSMLLSEPDNHKPLLPVAEKEAS